MTPVLDLVGWTEIGKMLDVSPQRAQQLAESRPDFPAQVGRTAAGPLFLRNDVQRFVAIWIPEPGRPRRAEGAPGFEYGELIALTDPETRRRQKRVWNTAGGRSEDWIEYTGDEALAILERKGWERYNRIEKPTITVDQMRRRIE